MNRAIRYFCAGFGVSRKAIPPLDARAGYKGYQTDSYAENRRLIVCLTLVLFASRLSFQRFPS